MVDTKSVGIASCHRERWFHQNGDIMREICRRQFLRALGFLPGAALVSHFRALAAAERGRIKIRDVKAMILQGPKTYTLVKVESKPFWYR